MKTYSFPKNYIWGAAASAYQIEGAPEEDGKGLSILDTFYRKGDNSYQNQTGDLAANHYHRMEEDVKLMAELGLKAYRFSVSWSRVLPDGIGKINQKGLDFYRRLVDALLRVNISPILTLFHYDLPLTLHEKGGWPNRDTADAFGDYACILGKALGDRVPYWITHNEPFVTAVLGYLTGEQAPGITDPIAMLASVHTLLLSHGKAVTALRTTTRNNPQIGIALNLSPVHTASESINDQKAARLFDGILNRCFIEPILLGQYPQDIINLFQPLMPEIKKGDMAIIHSPIDFLGINYYSRSVIAHDENIPFIEARQVHPKGREYSMMWEIFPEGIYELIKRVWTDYHPQAIFVTENGVPVPDGIDFDHKVRDGRRQLYIQNHLIQIHRAIEEKIPILGYLVWSFLDNFEWALGYQMRFGLVYVDFETQERIIKESAKWFSKVIKENRIMT